LITKKIAQLCGNDVRLLRQTCVVISCHRPALPEIRLGAIYLSGFGRVNQARRKFRSYTFLVRLATKWLLTSVVGGLLVTAGLFALPDSVVDATEDNPHPVTDKIVDAVFWPVASPTAPSPAKSALKETDTGTAIEIYAESTPGSRVRV
jgi:hypothetical protein